jgi:hypothetical protein
VRHVQARWFACLPDAAAAIAAHEGQEQGHRGRRARRGRPATMDPPPLESGYRLVVKVEALAKHTPSVRGREGLWHLDYRRARSLRAPEPEVVIPIRGRVPVAVRRAPVERVIVPPATQDGLVWPGPRLWGRHSAQAFCTKQ